MSDTPKSAATEAEPSAAFTPGPWLIEDQGESQEIVTQDGNWVVAWTTPKNANLIAAAPDLYEAAKAAKTLLVPDLDEPGRTVFWKLVDALAKAEGRS